MWTAFRYARELYIHTSSFHEDKKERNVEKNLLYLARGPFNYPLGVRVLGALPAFNEW